MSCHRIRSLVPDPDNPDCPAAFRDKVVDRLLDATRAESSKAIFAARIGSDPDPYRPDQRSKTRRVTACSRSSPNGPRSSLPSSRAASGKSPEPDEVLDNRSLVKWETSDPGERTGPRSAAHRPRTGAHAVMAGRRHRSWTLRGRRRDSPRGFRLGCQAIANDYNPIAYLILRATCEFPRSSASRASESSRTLASRT